MHYPTHYVYVQPETREAGLELTDLLTVSGLAVFQYTNYTMELKF